jgi:hypothetical protein
MTENLFKELFPYGGQLDQNNQWIKLSDIIPWDELEEIYRKYFSSVGRRAKDSRFINGLIIVKHKRCLSDEDVVEEFLENPYIQYFCGYDQFVTNKEIESSTLSKMRKRVGKEYFRKFETEIFGVINREKKIKSKEQIIDATVFPVNITYPTDHKLLEKVREWLVKEIKEIKIVSGIKEKVRTYARVARRVYLNFQKKKMKTKKEIEKVKKQLLRYVRRNILQLELLVCEAKELSVKISSEINKKLEIAKMIYEQQLQMVKNKTHRIKDRIVSFHRSHIRPQVRGKSGKEVEFGPKCVLSYVDGFLFLDEFSYDAFNEANRLVESISLHKERFGKKPEVVIGDGIFGNRENMKYVEVEGIKAAFKPLGRSKRLSEIFRKWLRIKQRIRNHIEGSIGCSKNNHTLDRILYRIDGGEEIWISI